jgi:hypothetical protein
MALTITGRKTIKTINGTETVEVPNCTFAPYRIDLTGDKLAMREGQIRICSNAITAEGELVEDGIYYCDVADLDDTQILFGTVTIKDIKDGIGAIAQIIRERADAVQDSAETESDDAGNITE